MYGQYRASSLVRGVTSFQRTISRSINHSVNQSIKQRNVAILSHNQLTSRPSSHINTHSSISSLPQSANQSINQPRRSFARSTEAPVSKEGNSAKFAYTLNGVTKRLDTGRTLFQNLQLQFYDGAKIGVLGVNGSGKSSFMKIVAGIDKEFEGSAYAFEGFKIGYLAQEPQLDETKSVVENVADGVADKIAILERFDAIGIEMGDPDADIDALCNEQAKLQETIDQYSLWDLQHQMDRAMEALGCPPPDVNTAHLSGGEKRRVALCRLLISRPDILLLDEPTNHLDAEAVNWLESFLATYPGLVMAITHDRYFLDNVAGYILEIDAGRLYPHRGNYGSWLMARGARLELEKKRDTTLSKIMKRELAWVQSGRRAQQAKSKVRLEGYKKLVEEKAERKRNKRSEGGAMCLPEGPALYERTILKVDQMTHWHDDKSPDEPILRDISFEVGTNDIVGIIGPNGTGKTTLLKLLVGEKEVKQGQLKVSKQVIFGYAGQHRMLDDDSPVWKEIVGVRETVTIDGDYSMPARAYVAQFNFSGQDQSKRCGSLSGGERNRASIAKALAQGCNVIVLDEPTNDLDVDTLRALEDSIEDWPGAALIVSHDRWFLDRVCNKLLVLEKDGTATMYDGGFADYESSMKNKSKGEERNKKFKKIG